MPKKPSNQAKSTTTKVTQPAESGRQPTVIFNGFAPGVVENAIVKFVQRELAEMEGQKTSRAK